MIDYTYIVAIGFSSVLAIICWPVGIAYAVLVAPNIMLLAEPQIASLGIAGIFFAFIARIMRDSQGKERNT